VSYSWTFGDGATSTVANPSHIYASQATYTATLTVTDNRGGKTSKSRQITVQPDLTKNVIVKSIAMSLVPSPSGTIARAQVIIVRKSDGAPITSATVMGTWSGLVSGTVSGITATDGKCTLSSPKTKRRGTYTFTVTNVSASGLTYLPAQNLITSNSITN
jgi:PKD repeat protein